MTTLQRVTKVIDWLIFEKKIKSRRELAQKMGYTESSMSQILNKKVALSDKFIKKFSIIDGSINENWLLIGEGEMLKQTESIVSEPTAICAINNTSKPEGIPYYEDIESSGSIIPSMNENGEEIPTFYINYEHFNDCTAYLQHVGESMYPKYCSGEIIAVKRIFNFDVVLWGEAHLIVTNANANNLRTVKLLFQHEDESKVILRASNPEYRGDTVVRKKDIISLFIIKGKITRNQL